MQTKIENLPEELRKEKRWACWAAEDKKPRNPYTGGLAKSNDPSTWGTISEAVEACMRYGFSGVGFMFSPPYFGVDLDHCVGSDDELIKEFVGSLQSYAEYSKSGTGIHIICRGKLPDGRRKAAKPKDPHDVEMYSEGRFFVCTGNPCSSYRSVAECTEQIKVLHAKYMRKSEFSVPVAMPMARTEMGDDEVIEKICNSKQSSLFMKLWQGNWADTYGSQSQADMSMCNMLAFWTGCDSAQMDRLFRQSGLYRPKWDERHGRQTYGEMTIGKSVAECRNVYSPVRYGNGSSVTLSQMQECGNEPRKSYDMTDTGNAQRMKDAFGRYIRYSHVSKEWYIWNKRRWVPDDMGWIKKLADIICEQLKKEAQGEQDQELREKKEKFASRSASSGRKEAMITETRHLDNIPITPSMMDSQPDLFNCQNGVLCLSTGELMPHDSSLLLTKITNAEYDDSGTLEPVRWKQFIAEITGGDRELALYLQKAVGYSMSGTAQEQCAFFLYGMGNNGKSTFLDVLSDIFGGYSANIQPETIMQQRQPSGGSGANSDIARLKGIRLVTCEEPSEGMRLNEGQLKQMTGGVPITARELYGKPFEFYPVFALWVATNNKPVIRDMTHGMWRRLKIIPFKVIIPKEKVDKELKYKLQAEYPGILRWCYEGYCMWKMEGLDEPSCVKTEVQEYKKEMDILATFLDACTVTDYGADKLRSQDLYRAYSRWAKEGNEYEMSSSKFFREVGKRVEKGRDSMGIFYKGIRLREEYDPRWENL